MPCTTWRQAWVSPQNDVGVPFLIIGEHVLIGSGEIPTELPGLIDSYLAAGGVDFPDTPALAPLLSQQTATETSQTPESADAPQAAPTAENPAASQITAEPPSAPNSPAAPVEITAFQGNNGFLWAWLILFLLTGALAFSLIYIFQNRAAFSAATLASPSASPSDWLTLILALIGLGVAAYLAYVETQAVKAFCGPVGDCNTVQSSPYARLFGVLPIGVLGMLGYILILLAGWLRRTGRTPWSGWAALALLGMSLGGTLFSIYLTYLEVAVIRAVCLWCLSSALIMGGLLVLSLNLGLPSPHPLPKDRSGGCNHLSLGAFTSLLAQAERQAPLPA